MTDTWECERKSSPDEVKCTWVTLFKAIPKRGDIKFNSFEIQGGYF